MKIKNPALHLEKFFKVSKDADSRSMSLYGVIQKSLILLSLVLLGSGINYYLLNLGYLGLFNFCTGIGLIGSIGLGFLTIFVPNFASITAPLYALCQGFSVGAISFFASQELSGVVSCALLLTASAFIALLLGYRLNLIKVNDTFKSVLFSSLIGILAIYFIELLISLFGNHIPFLYSSGITGIIYSIFVITIASMCLIADFDRINQACNLHLPKKAEWYASFGLMVSVIWLYVEIINLLLKLNKRR